MKYQLVIRERNGCYWAFYCNAYEPPTYNFGDEQVMDKTIKGVLKKARLIKPSDGEVSFTYIDRNGS